VLQRCYKEVPAMDVIPYQNDPTVITCCGVVVQIMSAASAVTYWCCTRCARVGGTPASQSDEPPRDVPVPARRITMSRWTSKTLRHTTPRPVQSRACVHETQNDSRVSAARLVGHPKEPSTTWTSLRT